MGFDASFFSLVRSSELRDPREEETSPVKKVSRSNDVVVRLSKVALQLPGEEAGL